MSVIFIYMCIYIYPLCLQAQVYICFSLYSIFSLFGSLTSFFALLCSSSHSSMHWFYFAY